MTDMKFKGLTEEDIVDAMVLPVNLGNDEQLEADLLLAEHRKKRRNSDYGKQVCRNKLLQLKFQLEDYIQGTEYNANCTFSYFLKQYIQILNKKQKEFAHDVDVSDLQLSHYLNNRRSPNESFIIRLEIHSNNSISALTWFRLLEKEKEYHLITNKAIRIKEKKHVSNMLSLDF